MRFFGEEIGSSYASVLPHFNSVANLSRQCEYYLQQDELFLEDELYFEDQLPRFVLKDPA